jgi:hypothetical protein
MDVKSRDVFAVIGNTDCTEGRGGSFVKAYCDTLATAKRLGKKGYIQGSDCPVEVKTLYKVEGNISWLGPVKIQAPNDVDRKVQVKLDEVQLAIDAAKSAGLTDEQIKLIRLM